MSGGRPLGQQQTLPLPLRSQRELWGAGGAGEAQARCESFERDQHTGLAEVPGGAGWSSEEPSLRASDDRDAPYPYPRAHAGQHYGSLLTAYQQHSLYSGQARHYSSRGHGSQHSMQQQQGAPARELLIFVCSPTRHPLPHVQEEALRVSRSTQASIFVGGAHRRSPAPTCRLLWR